MSQDVVADGLNQMMNALRAKKTSLTLKKHSKLLLSILAIAKLKGYVTSYKVAEDGRQLTIELGKLNGCNAVKPRFVVQVDEIEKFASRYLPARDLGIIIISTSQGIMTHQTAIEKNVGGSILAYMY
ncbi:MAG TPA: 30S ribosomal protein S8 [Candidatus Nanoarchaeia archaeon]|nr:30S ribosomal protein S8 [Candidatus Nanoarchaeia archaeon]